MLGNKVRLGRTLPMLAVLFFAFSLFVPNFVNDSFAKDAFAERAFAEEAFAKEVLAEEEVAEGAAAEDCEISQDVFYKDWEGNPLKGCVSGNPAPELGETDYNGYSFAPSRMILWISAGTSAPKSTFVRITFFRKWDPEYFSGSAYSSF